MSGTIRSDRWCSKFSFLVNLVFVVRIHAAELGRVVCIKNVGLIAPRSFKALRANRGLDSERDFLRSLQLMKRRHRQIEQCTDCELYLTQYSLLPCVRLVQYRTCCLKVFVPPETLLPMPTATSKSYGGRQPCTLKYDVAGTRRVCWSRSVMSASVAECAVLRNTCCELWGVKGGGVSH